MQSSFHISELIGIISAFCPQRQLAAHHSKEWATGAIPEDGLRSSPTISQLLGALSELDAMYEEWDLSPTEALVEKDVESLSSSCGNNSTHFPFPSSSSVEFGTFQTSSLRLFSQTQSPQPE